MKSLLHSTAGLSFPLASALAALLTAHSLHAANGTWNFNGDDNWTNSTRWTGGIIADGTDSTANFTVNISGFRTVTLAADRTIGNIIFTDSTTSSHDLAISGANILTLDTTTGAPVIDVTQNGRFLFINSPIAGNDGLQKNGLGGLTLSGANSYSGTTTINAGRIQFASQASLYGNIDTNWTEANINVKSGASIGFSVGGTGEFTTANITTLLTNLAVSSSATSGMNAGSTFVFNAANATGGSFTIADVIADSTGASGGSRALNKVGAGTLVLSGANTYTGVTTVSGGTLQIENTSASTSVSIGSGATLSLAADTVFSPSTPLTIAAGTIASGRTASGPGLTHVFGNTQIGNGSNSFIAGPNVTSGTAAIQLGNVTNDNASVATPQLNPTTANLIITGSVTLGTSVAGTADFTLGGAGSVNSIAGGIVNGTRATANVIKQGSSTWTLSGANTYNGTTAVNGGLLILDYSSQNNSKLSNTAVLTLGNATLNLSGGSHTETVLSTTLGINTASRVTSSGSSVLQMNGITRNAGATIDFGAPNIASTDTTNTNGILGAWATIAGTDFAANSTNGLDGLITAPVYSDVTRLNSGPQVVADGSTTNVRIIEGTGGAADITLGAAITTINTLNHSISGGTGAGTIDSGTQTLRTNAILMGPTAGALTLGNGFLSTATAGGDLRLINNSANGITINSVIANNTTASTLIKQGTGTVTLGNANLYTGTTIVNQGTLTVGASGSLGSTTAALAVNNDNSSGAVTNTILNLTSSGNTTVGTLSGVITPLVSGTNTATINTGGSGLDFIVNQAAASTYAGVIAGAGNFIFNGSATNTLTLSGANTHTGTTTVGTGALILGNVNALGTSPGVNGTSGITMATGTILRSSISGVTVSTPITATGSVTFGAPNNNAGQVFSELILNGAIGGAGTTNVNFDSFLNSNTIQTVTLGAANTYSGNTTIGATTPGTASQVFVKLAVNDALPTTTILSIQGGTGAGTGRGVGLNLFGFNQTLAGLTNTAATARVQQVVNSDASAAATLTINSSSPTTYSGNLGSNSPNFSLNAAAIPGSTNGNNFGLTKTGPSTFTLSGTNTYTGDTTVSAGVLVVDGSLANTSTTVSGTGTLKGQGTIGGSVTIGSGGTLASGNSIQSLATGALGFTVGSNFEYELNKDAAANLAGDLTAVAGSLSLTGAVTLNLVETGTGAWQLGSPVGDHLLGSPAADKLTLISYTGTWNGGLFTYLGNLVQDDSPIVLNGQQWWFNYNDTDAGTNFTGDLGLATSFVTMTVPEPNVAALIGGLGCVLLLRRRR